MKKQIKEVIVKLPLLGSKKVLEGSGDFSTKDIENFKIKAANYFYGIIHPTVVNHNHADFAGMKPVINHTLMIDLKKTEEELWNALDRKSIRWGINYAKKNGLYTNFIAVKDRVKIQILKNYESIDGLRYEAKILADGYLIIDEVNEYSILEATHVTDEGKKYQAMPLMYWELMKYSKNAGMLSWDMGGYGGDKSYGKKINDIDTFKLRFGGKVVEQPIYSTNWRYPFLRKILKLCSFMKNIYKKE